MADAVALVEQAQYGRALTRLECEAVCPPVRRLPSLPSGPYTHPAQRIGSLCHLLRSGLRRLRRLISLGRCSRRL